MQNPFLGGVSFEQGAAKAHKKKSHKFSESLLYGRVSLGHPAGVPATLPFSVNFSKEEQQKILGTPAGRRLFVPRVLRRFFKGSAFSEGFLEGTLRGFQWGQGFLEGFLEGGGCYRRRLEGA